MRGLAQFLYVGNVDGGVHGLDPAIGIGFLVAGHVGTGYGRGGGLGKGGRSYYALDITDPDAPTLLWEITTTSTGFANLGLTYGNPGWRSRCWWW